MASAAAGDVKEISIEQPDDELVGGLLVHHARGIRDPLREKI